MKGVILHGGYGTRLRPLTHTGPKQLIPVANKPISQYVLESLRDIGIHDIAIILGDIHTDKVKEYYGDGSRFGTEITYINQGEPRGIAHAVGLCKDFVSDDSFVVHLGDDLIKGGVKAYINDFESSACDGMFLLCRVKEPERFGVAEFDASGKVIRLVEKPKTPPSDYALVGVYFFKPIIFDMIHRLKPSWRGELEITEAIQLLLDNGNNIGFRFVEGWWKDTGTPEDILESNRLILDEIVHNVRGIVEDGASVQGRVNIGEGATIKRNAMIRGPAAIGKHTIIEGQVYIGPYTSVGNNALIKQGEIENSIIMDDCYIDVKEKITDSVIGPSSTLTMNHAGPRGYRLIVGENSRVSM